MFKKERKAPVAHAGFSLIAVLVVAVIGMALIGITFYIHESSAGASSLTMQRSLEYNVLQDALERGKSNLVQLCNNLDPVPRWPGRAAGTTKITSPASLVIDNGTFTENVRINNVSGTVRVEILDAGYSMSEVDTAALTNVELMPPSMNITGSANDSIGAYLVRATLTLGGESKRLESTVFQRNLSTTGGVVPGGGEDGNVINP